MYIFLKHQLTAANSERCEISLLALASICDYIYECDLFVRFSSRVIPNTCLIKVEQAVQAPKL